VFAGGGGEAEETCPASIALRHCFLCISAIIVIIVIIVSSGSVVVSSPSH
jgi:hypothetical protein